MKKYIDRDEFVNRINENVELTDPEEQEWVKDECIRQAHAMPSVNVGEWISVDERLPDKSGEYLTWHGRYYGLLMYSVEKQGWNITYCDDRSTEITSVTHWMPLPEPPKGE